MAGRRLFVAAWLPEHVHEVLAALPRPDEAGVRWTQPEQWHVTMRFLGRAEPDEAIAALRRVRGERLTATLGPAVSRLGRTVLCVPAQGLDGLAAEVRRATAAVGVPPDPRPFAGHVTLARLRRRGSCRLAGHRLSVSFEVGELALVESETLPEGARYTTLATHALG